MNSNRRKNKDAQKGEARLHMDLKEEKKLGILVPSGEVHLIL